MSRKEIRIAGFGGQGIVLSGVIIGKAAAIFDNNFASLSQSYGPESRGGSCHAEIVISDEPVDYPYVIDPEVVILLSQEAYNKFEKKISKKTLVVVDPDFVKVDLSKKFKYITIPAQRMAQELGNKLVANIIVIGFLAAISDIISSEALKKAVLDSVPAGTVDLNTKAFESGYKYGVESNRKTRSRRI